MSSKARGVRCDKYHQQCIKRDVTTKQKVRRCLFGRPTKEQVARLMRSLEKSTRQSTQAFIRAWNFDVVNDKPVAGKYDWEKDLTAVNSIEQRTERQIAFGEFGSCSFKYEKILPRKPSKRKPQRYNAYGRSFDNSWDSSELKLVSWAEICL